MNILWRGNVLCAQLWSWKSENQKQNAMFGFQKKKKSHADDDLGL